MTFPRLMTVTLALAVSCSAFAQTERDLTVEQNTAAQAGQSKQGTLRVAASVDRQDLTYAVGETVRIFVQPNEDAYITVINVGPSGQVTQLFPNAYQKNNRVEANQRVEITPSDSGARIAVSGPIGAELIKVIASVEPIKVIPESALEGRGAFRSVTGGVSELARNLEAVATTQPPTQGLAIHNLLIKTIASRASVGNGSSVVVLPTQPAPQPTPAAAPASVPPASVPAPVTIQATAPSAPDAAPVSAPVAAPVSAPTDAPDQPVVPETAAQ